MSSSSLFSEPPIWSDGGHICATELIFAHHSHANTCAANDGRIVQPLPELLEKNKADIEAFAKDLHDKVLDPLNRLIAIALELPEDYLTNLHKWETHDESHLRYMKYSKFTPEEIEKLSDGLWARGHTDLGTMTLLFRQPVAALQIRDHKTNQWKWAKPLDGSLTVNTCDALSFLTAGYIKSTIHRVSERSPLPLTPGLSC